MDPAGQPARHRPGVRTGRQLSADTGAWRRTARPAVDRELKGVLALAAAASPDQGGRWSLDHVLWWPVCHRPPMAGSGRPTSARETRKPDKTAGKTRPFNLPA